MNNLGGCLFLESDDRFFFNGFHKEYLWVGNGHGFRKRNGPTEFTDEDLRGPVLLLGKQIIGPIKFKGGKTFDPPDGGWNLDNFMKTIAVH